MLCSIMQSDYMQSLSGKKAFVIGGSGGIGVAICRQLAQCGCSLIVHGGHESSGFDSLVNELQTLTHTEAFVQYFEPDFGEHFFTTDFNNAVDTADIICVCFGPFLQKSLHCMSCEDWQKIVQLNCMLPGLVLSAALPQMIKKGWGRFLCMGGTRTERINAFSSNAGYAAAKTAVSSLIRSTALAYAQYGITCNGIFPGFTQTHYMDSHICAELAKKMPQKKLIQPEEIAETVVHVLQQPMINGALIAMDGGWDPAFPEN